MINDEMIMQINKITLYFIGAIKQVLKIICDNETINILLYLKKSIPKISEIKIVHIAYISISLNSNEFLTAHMGMCHITQVIPTYAKALFFPFAAANLFNKKPLHAISSSKAVTNK
jgi:hypothetical protein